MNELTPNRKRWALAIAISLMFHGTAIAALQLAAPVNSIVAQPLKISLSFDHKPEPVPRSKISDTPKKREQPKAIKKEVKQLIQKSTAKKKTSEKLKQKTMSRALSSSDTSKSQSKISRPAVKANYEQQVASLIAKNKRYPRRALRRKKEGHGLISVLILADGSVSKSILEAESGSKILDKEMLEMVERAQPFPPFPKELRGSSIKLIIPINFKLN